MKFLSQGGEKNGMSEKKTAQSLNGFHRLFPFLFNVIFAVAIAHFSVLTAAAQNKYENRPINNVEVALEGGDQNAAVTNQFRATVDNVLEKNYSTVKIREAIQSLYDSGKVVSVQVEASESGQGGVNLRFLVKRKTQAGRITVELAESDGDEVTEDQILLRTNISNPGVPITEQSLQENAEAIQLYLRNRGFYNAEVTYSQVPVTGTNQVSVVFKVNPREQAKFKDFNINIAGFDPAIEAEIAKKLELKKDERFTNRKLERDLTRVRQALIKEDFIAPQLEDTRPVFDPETNTVSVNLTGKVGPKVVVNVDAGDEKIGKSKQTELLPIKREGTLEQSAIVEGERRLRNYFQEKGYFFASTGSTCSVEPAIPGDAYSAPQNGTSDLCASLAGADLDGKNVEVNYKVDLSRKLKLVDIRITGTDKINYEELSTVFDSQKASLLGIIPGLGYGRGYTSNEILAADRDRVENIMQQLGYRQAKVTALQGVSPNGEDLIITFNVVEGIPTVIDSVEIAGNKEFATDTLRAEIPNIVGKNYSRARARNGVQKLSALYAREGYYDAKISFSEVPQPQLSTAQEERTKIVYNIENEGKKVFISRILVDGNERTKREAILKALNIKEGEVLRASDIFTSEQNLYASDAFKRVEVKPEAAGETVNGDSQREVVVNLEEQPPRILTYGGGYSTDFGATGFFDIRDVNLFGKLYQGGARVRMSQRQQLVQLDFLNPRFIKDGEKTYAPLTITAQYQRDSTITRFFRSTFDQGTFGVVQRLDEEGNPINTFGERVDQPTINRASITAETQKTLSRKNRSILFFRYRYEDVRIMNVDSLLVGDLLRPDEKVRTSGFGASFVRDTRENCNRKYSVLELISKGELGDPCKYSSSNPTRGNYISLDYRFSAPVLGANIGYQKFQGTYQTYYQLPKISGKLDNTLLAGRIVLGLANVFSRNQTFSGTLAPLNGSLPISERFFAGGSTTLRGFDFEQAGPRVVVVPQGVFRNSDNEQVFLSPFTIPFGGNALVVANLEARIPLSETISAVPFYDGGNVFNRVGDIFKPLRKETGDVFTDNLRANFKHTVGFGVRVKTPFGGDLAIDYGYLLDPPQFLIPQTDGSNAIYRLKQGQLHFRFSQSF